MRDAVTHHVARQARRFPEVEHGTFAWDGADRDERDAALGRAIEHAVMRRWLTLAAVLSPLLPRPWPDQSAAVQAALLVGAAQLLLLDRVPDHAAINAAVEWMKHHRPARASGLVNAVLRRVSTLRGELVDIDLRRPPERTDLPLPDGRAWRLREPAFADDLVTRVSQQASLPMELMQVMIDAHGRDEAFRLAWHGIVPAPVILTGVTDTADGDLQRHTAPGSYAFTGSTARLEALLRSTSSARVQDPGTAAALQVTAGLRPKLIADVCAGRGTKTRQLLALHPHAEVLATDRDPARLAALRAGFEGDPRVEIVPYGDFARFAGRVDLLVLDVPCSNTGVLARRIEARYRYSPAALRRLVEIQRQIVADSLAMLADAGRLAYITCSVDPAENRRQVEWMSRWHGLELELERTALPSGLPGDDPVAYTDGGYAALLAPGAVRR